jgi:hypothetical protein
VAVAESGIRTGADVRALRDAGFDAFLVGEHLMRSPDPGAALEELLTEAGEPPGRARPMPGRRLFVKICGITSARDCAHERRSRGPTRVGFVFWRRSPRFVDARAARRIAEALPASILRVGVFVDAAPRALATAVERAGLDVLQLHGSEAPDALQGLPRTVWKAVRVGEGFALVEALALRGEGGRHPPRYRGRSLPGAAVRPSTGRWRGRCASGRRS